MRKPTFKHLDRDGWAFRWAPLWYFELRWKHWAVELGFSFGAWHPPEFSMHWAIGPLAGCLGVEAEWESDWDMMHKEAP